MTQLIPRCLLTEKARVLVSTMFKASVPLHIFTSLHTRHTIAHLNVPLVFCPSAGVFGIFSFRNTPIPTELYRSSPELEFFVPVPEISCCLSIHTSVPSQMNLPRSQFCQTLFLLYTITPLYMKLSIYLIISV